MRTAPNRGRRADERSKSRDALDLGHRDAPVNETPTNGDGRYSHSTACELLARSGLFDLTISHLLLALARQPHIDAAFEAERAQDDRCFRISLSDQTLKGNPHL